MDVLSGLDTFLVVASAGSISRAARLLDVPRSTISRRLKKLEAEVGDPILEVRRGALMLTPAGEMLVQRGKPLVAGLQALREDLHDHREGPTGTLRISCMPGLGASFLPAFLDAQVAHAPRLVVDIVVREGVPDLLAEGIDAAIVEGPLSDAAWIKNALGTVETFAVASPAYLAAHGTPTDVAELAQHVCLGTRRPTMSSSEWPLIGGGVVPVRPRIHCNDMELVRQTALAGKGIALLPNMITALDIRDGRLVPILPALGRTSSLEMVTIRRRKHSARVRALFDIIEAVSAQYTDAS